MVLTRSPTRKEATTRPPPAPPTPPPPSSPPLPSHSRAFLTSAGPSDQANVSPTSGIGALLTPNVDLHVSSDSEMPRLQYASDSESVSGSQISAISMSDTPQLSTPQISTKTAPTSKPTTGKSSKSANSNMVIELPAHSEEVKGIDSFMTVITKLTYTINKAVNEGKSVTASNKRLISTAAQEIQRAAQALARVNEAEPKTAPPPPASEILPDQSSIVSVIRESIREELKAMLPAPAPSPPALTKSFAAAVAAPSPKRIPPPSRTLPSIIVKAKEANDKQTVVYDEWRKHISFRHSTFAPNKVKSLRQNMIKVEFDTNEQRDEVLHKVNSIPGIVAEESKLRRPLIILKGVSKEVQREELVEVVSHQNQIPPEDVRLCFLLKNRNDRFYNAVLEVAPAIRRRLVEGERVNVEHQRVHVADFSRFVQCYKCLQFGHTNGKCTAEFYPCAHCGSTAHHVTSCPDRANPDKKCCYNCKSVRSANTNHAATDNKLCPRIVNAVKSLQESTDYVKACIVTTSKVAALGITQLSTANLVIARVSLGLNKLEVASFYIEPNTDNDNTIEKLDRFLRSAGSSLRLVGGDANGSHQEWGEASANSRGEDVVAVMASHNMVVCNVGHVPTFEAIRHGAHCSSVVDITYSSQSLADAVHKWRVNSDACPSSDHNAVEYELHTARRPEKPKSTTTFRFSTYRADWDRFREKLNERMEPLIAQTQLDSLTGIGLDRVVERLTAIVQDTCYSTLPRKLGAKFYNPWWSDDLELQKKECIRLHHRLHDLKKSKKPLDEVIKLYTKAKQEYARTLSKTSTDHFRQFCEAQGKEDVWAVTNRIIKDSPLRRPPQTLNCGGAFTDSGENTASALLKHFYPDDTPDNYSEHQETRAAMSESPNTEDDLLFSEAEIRECLSHISPKKAPGADHLTSDICSAVFEAQPDFLTALHNRCLQIGHFPKPWKRAVVKILPKPGKTDMDSLSSYRPIGLICVFGKILEKLIVKRIMYKAECENSLNTNQFGFREQTSTTDALGKALEVIRTAKSNGRQVVAVSLDIKAAFDNAWWPALFKRLQHIKCPKNIYHLIRNYVTDRIVTLNYADGEASKSMSKGCVQGSACGPVFWNLILDELLNIQLPEAAHIQAFADDVLLIVEGKTREEVETATGKCLDIIHSWGKRVKLQFGPEKTQAISFTAQTKQARITISNTVIPILKQIKLLGIIIDDKLNFIQHSKYIIGKATKIFKNLCKFVRPTWGVHSENVECIYRQVITPIITYAAGIWGTAIKFYSVRQALRAFQRAFAIRAIRGFHTISAVAAEALAQFPPLHLVIKEAYEVHNIKTTGTFEDLPQDIKLHRRVPIKDLLHPAKRISISFAETTTQIDTNDLINPDAPNIFTDGSKKEDGQAGASFVVMKEDQQPVIKKFKLCRTASVFMCELFAIAEALKWLKNSNRNFAEALIFSDSQSSLKAIQDRSNTDPLVNQIHHLISFLSSIHITVKFIWSKAHAGIVGNEIADVAAKEAAEKKTATLLNHFPLSHAKRLLRQRTLDAWQSEYEAAPQGAITKSFFSSIHAIAEFRKFVKISFTITQILTGHGYHKSYLHKYKITEDDRCPCDDETPQDVHHLLEHCPIFYSSREKYTMMCLKMKIEPFNIVALTKSEQVTKYFIEHVNYIVTHLKQINGT
ncbi:uncharacterized protein LOC106141549 [Amyelois transitella]|uniref:uncharacterized protein LOC132902758 n=1 Tax=Amyelois transitella TaxID=680683 RepID=UPI00298F7ED8|nr:uncharacterized protein LOC132902758 [Amyelois transitella]XP_060805250.1 uncharacterized protein LOC132902820 [Amyelois transitella]XP_060807914.1 uncharacterized protein LOC106141549 [Amyelois transitella]